MTADDVNRYVPCIGSVGVEAVPIIVPDTHTIPSLASFGSPEHKVRKLRYGVLIGFIAAFQNPDWPVDLRLTRREEEL